MTRPPDPARFPYADARKLLRETFEALLPPTRISVAEHATEFRWVKSTTGAHLERYDHATAPYLRGPMEALTAEGIETVAIVGPASSGKTAGPAESWLLQTIHADPAEMLWYMPTDALVDAYVKGRIEPMLEAHDKIIGGLRVGRDSLSMKRFRGGRVEFLPFTPNAMINKHVQRIVCDEWDACDPAMGDPLAWLNPRRQAAGADSKLLAISHPDRGLPIHLPRERQQGIMRLYVDSNRGTWWWPCPHCGGHSSPNHGTSRRMVITWPEAAPLDVIEAEARLLCPCCARSIEDQHRRAMNQRGRWIFAGEEIDEDGRVTGTPIVSRTAGFWIHGMMSSFIMGGIGALASNRVAAERALTAGGDASGLRTVMVKNWGEPYAPPRHVGTVDAQALAERVEERLTLGIVPEGVRVITTSVDVQGGRFELLSRGWGVGMESWVLEYRIIHAEPATSPDDWDDLLDVLGLLSYPLADGSGRHLRVRCAVFDSAGQPGVTEQAYAAWRRARLKRLPRLVGTIEGRDAWTILPAKGASSLTAPFITLAKIDSQRKDRNAGGRGEPVLFFNPSRAKDSLASNLARTEPGPGTIHFPAGLLSLRPPHAFFEQLAAERRRPDGRWEHVEKHLRNEVTDLMTMTEAAARLHGVHRLRWDAPPPWAAHWPSNTMVIDAPEMPVPRPVAVPAVGTPPAPQVQSLNLAALRQAMSRNRLTAGAQR